MYILNIQVICLHIINWEKALDVFYSFFLPPLIHIAIKGGTYCYIFPINIALFWLPPWAGRHVMSSGSVWGFHLKAPYRMVLSLHTSSVYSMVFLVRFFISFRYLLWLDVHIHVKKK